LELVRTYGLWLLLLPLAWCIWSITSTDEEGVHLNIMGRPFIVGVGLTAGLMVLFTCAALSAFYGWPWSNP
jgi:hypothetical protein